MSKAVKFSKIVPEGKALGYVAGRACFCVGPLPDEAVMVRVTKMKPRYVEAVVTEIVEPSPRRNEPAEEHFMICSPWQGVDYDYQLELKRGMLAETMGRPELALSVLDMVAAPERLGYRNKLEFSVVEAESRRLELAFHERGSLTKLVPVPAGCALGSAAMNAAARHLLERVNELELADRVESLTVRQSHHDGGVLGIVTLRRSAKREWNRLQGSELAGVVVSRLRDGRRQELVWQAGRTELVEYVGGVELRYPYDGFFQTNVAAFELALERIVAAVPEGARVVDLYGGVGTIGLAVAQRAREVVGVEINAHSVEQANANAERAGLTNYKALAVSAERMEAAVLADADCVIVDPPRAGLHKRVVDRLLAAKPARIIYLSCNPVTQARDLMLLGEQYRAEGVTGFDFYPGTLHLESLAVLERAG